MSSRWLARRTHTLQQTESMHGRLMHAALVVRDGRARLVALGRILGIFSAKPFAPHHPVHGVNDDLEWWAARLAQRVFCPIPGPVVVADLPAFSDASSGVGIGIVLGDRWRAWRLLPGWDRDGRDIGWAEAVGFELLVRCVLDAPNHPPRFRVYGDNQGVVEGWRKGCSRNTAVNGVFRRILALERRRCHASKLQDIRN